jgi:RNA 2',3'-cyclic 3'-phosphodiesterase
MRAFVAVFPPPEVRREALAWVRRLPSYDRVRWTRPENVHLTLKFLGDVRAETLDSIRAALGEVCAEHAPFDAVLAELGAFPSARRAKILWIGVGAGSDRLRSLAADVDDALASLGFGREKRPYVPHLTLGRVRGRPLNLDLPSGVEGNGFRVRRVELTESTLAPKGATYRTVGDFALVGKPENGS